MMEALIVDDEIHAREELDSLLTEIGEFNIIGKCSNALDAMKIIRTEKPDVVFLDVQMPVIGGFELLGMIEEEFLPHVIFVTAYDSYAFKAFEENAVDYLLKPVEKSRLIKAVQKLKKALAEGKMPSIPLSPPVIKRIPCIIHNRIKLINLSEIEYVKSGPSGVHAVCPAGEFFTELTLKVFETRTDLLRCHKQYLVNVDRIDEIILRENMLAEIKTKSGKSIPVSRRYLKFLKDRFIY